MELPLWRKEGSRARCLKRRFFFCGICVGLRALRYCDEAVQNLLCDCCVQMLLRVNACSACKHPSEG